MGSNYEKYNQAIAQEKQLQQIEAEIRPQVEEQLKEVESSESTFNKNLRYAVISNENVDLKSASQTKQEYSQVKNELQEPLRQIDQERSRINQQKSGVKSMDQLEAQGYKKEVRGGQIIYYKEDTYRRKKGEDRRTFRDEEYIFNSDGTPVQIIKRDDYNDGDRRRVDEEEVVQFDSQGRVSQVRTYRDGEKDEKTSYSFNSDGSMSIKSRDYEKERKLQEKAQKEYESQLAEQRKYKNITASVDIYGNSEYSETAYNEKTGQWEKTTTSYTKQQQVPSQKVSSTKTLEATKVKIEDVNDQFKIDNIQQLGLSPGVPGVNQGTSTPEQIQAMQNVKATAITGREVVFSFSKPEKDQVNLNPARILVAPYEMGSAIGSYLASNVKGDASIVQDVKKGYSKVKEQGIIETGKNIVVGTLEHVSTDPFGFTGEGLALGGAGKVTKEAVVKATTKVRPIEVNARSVSVETSPNSAGLGVERVEISGSAEVTQGIFKKKSRVVEFEGEGLINKETRALGSRDPDGLFVKQENAVSREISPANLYEGEIKVSAEGKTTKVKVDGISQGNKQITNVNKETFVSETQSVGKLNNDDLFMTRTENIKTGDVSVTTSRNVKSQGTTKPTQDAFASASESQTDVFFNKKDLTPSKEKIVDAELAQTKIGETRVLENKGPQPIQAEQFSDDIKISNLDEINAKRTSPKSEPNQRDFTNSGQSQVFEQKVSQNQGSTSVASFENNFLDDASQMFKTETRSTNIPISSKTIKDVVTGSSKTPGFAPSLSTKSRDAFSQTDLFSTDQRFSLDNIQDQGSSQKPGQDSRTKTDVDVIQDPMRDSGFKQEVAQQTSQRNVNDPIMRTPNVPKFNTMIEPPVRPKLDVDFNDDFSLDDPFSSKKKRGSHKGQFAGSLTALVQGIEIDKVDPNKKTTGLSKRAILRGRGF